LPSTVPPAHPARPLRLILGYPAGGSTDLVASIMGAWLTDRLGQSVVIENRPGAGTNLAVQAVVASPPDGYTLLFAATTNAINASFHATLPFDFLRDLAPVAGLVELPFVMKVNPSVPANTVAEFIAHANPGKINTATFGTGTRPGSCSSSWPTSTWFTYRTTRIQRDARR
jgi:tripartite-type tricarboxylate transporter receptor subunit TctC